MPRESRARFVIAHSRAVLGAADASRIEQRIAEIEAAHGLQVVCAVQRRSDPYREAAWQAFAIGAVLAACISVALDLLRPSWVDSGTLLLHVGGVLAGGAVLALATLASPALTRALVPPDRRMRAVRRRAKEFFHDHVLSAASTGGALLLLVSALERKVELIADPAAGLDPAALGSIVDVITRALERGSSVDALIAGLHRLDDLLAAVERNGGEAGRGIADTVLQEDPR